MPAKKKKQRRLRPYEKVLNFLEAYKRNCQIFDVPQLDNIKQLYDPVIEKHGRRIPQLLQFADEEVDPCALRPLIETYQNADQTYNIKIRFLSFLNTNLGDNGMHVLAYACLPPLEVAGIACHSNNIGPSGCRGFARGMVQSEFLAVLELDFNPGIGDEGVKGLVHYGHCKTLNKLSLRFCDIGDEGAAALGKWIALDTCKIKEILLNGNRIGPKGATAIGENLGKNKSIVRIDLADNLFGFDKDCLMAIHNGIQGCPTIQGINMLNHFECPEGMDQKFFELTQSKPLGECVLTVKMDPFIFQNTRSIAMANKKKMAKEAKKARLAAKKAAKAGLPPPGTEEAEKEEQATDATDAQAGATTTTSGVSPDPPTDSAA